MVAGQHGAVEKGDGTCNRLQVAQVALHAASTPSMPSAKHFILFCFCRLVPPGYCSYCTRCCTPVGHGQNTTGIVFELECLILCAAVEELRAGILLVSWSAHTHTGAQQQHVMPCRTCSVVPSGMWCPQACGALRHVVPSGMWCPQACGALRHVVPSGMWCPHAVPSSHPSPLAHIPLVLPSRFPHSTTTSTTSTSSARAHTPQTFHRRWRHPQCHSHQ
jgi:hypothetical protein